LTCVHIEDYKIQMSTLNMSKITNQTKHLACSIAETVTLQFHSVYNWKHKFHSIRIWFCDNLCM